MDRKPLPPPFPVGTRLRYTGTYRSFADADGKIPLHWPGMEVTVEKVVLGRQGTLRPVGGLWDDTGEPILDETKDGYSVWVNPKINQGRIIWPAKAGEWKRLP